MLTEQDIIYLFDEVWPEMEYSALHRDNCLGQIEQINSLFRRYGSNFNDLLNALDTLEGIGLTIASGLIFSANRTTMAPFDKYTMGWAVELDLVHDNRISENNYAQYSKSIVEHINDSKHLSDILNFVREARENAQFPLIPE